MACVRKRRGKWVVDYRDGGGARRWVTCRTKREAETVLAERVLEGRQARRLAVDPNMQITEYSLRWLQLIASNVKPRTLQSYELSLRRHIVPAFGAIRLRQLVRGQVKEFLAEKLVSGLARNTVRIIHATLRAMLNAAIDDGVILANPADRLGRQFRLTTTAKDREQEIKAMDGHQLSGFLAAAKDNVPLYYPLFFAMARTGLRVGETLALRWEDIDFPRREVCVNRNVSRGHTGTPKGGRSRRVDMSSDLTALLRGLEVKRKTEALRAGTEVCLYVFTTRVGSSMDPSRVAKAFKRVLRAAGLPLHFSPHCLRHTFASLLVQQGESPAYVQRQLGHASIQLTVDTYGRWLPMGNKAAVDRLDETDKGSRLQKSHQRA